MSADPFLPPTDDAEEPAQGGRKMDTEIRSISAILRQLDDLPEEARPRVVAYIHSRFVSAQAACNAVPLRARP